MFVWPRVKWPHEFFLSGSLKECISYGQLTMPQWMAGFCRTMRDETNQNLKDHMLNYLIDLMDDANDFSWGVVKASHAVVLGRMEQGEVTGYDQVRTWSPSQAMILLAPKCQPPKKLNP